MERTKRLLIAGVLLASTAGCMHDKGASVGIEKLPEALLPPSGEVLAITARGAGFQIYECRSDQADTAMFVWTLKAPEAQLRYEAGKPLGKHYAGPTWEADDGSKVTGEVVAHGEAPDATAIPWLLLRAKSTYGSGVFTGVSSIQRLHTVGGKPPTTGCDRVYAGTEARVAYTADYYFYR